MLPKIYDDKKVAFGLATSAPLANFVAIKRAQTNWPPVLTCKNINYSMIHVRYTKVCYLYSGEGFEHRCGHLDVLKKQKKKKKVLSAARRANLLPN